ncbi:MAG: hypothetical protein R2856_05835 [Caldilineaceae bacterium]
MAGSFQHNETYGYGGPTTDEILGQVERNPGRPHRRARSPSATWTIRSSSRRGWMWNLRRARAGIGLSAGTTEIEGLGG